MRDVADDVRNDEPPAKSTMDAHDRLTGLIFGWWSSRLLEAGTRLGVFEIVPTEGTMASDALADALGGDRSRTYRLLRALASIGALEERDDREFALAPMGRLLRDEPGSLRAMALHEISPFSFGVWSELENVVREPRRNGVELAHGEGLWHYLAHDDDVNRMFNLAMTSYSALETPAVIEELEPATLPAHAVVCDVGGGHGALLAALLRERPDLRGVVVELAATAAEATAGSRHGDLGDRLEFVAGDAFVDALPSADVYILKHVLHDFDDDECSTLLTSVRAAARPGARLFVCEFVVPEPREAQFAKIMDVHMMLMNRGRERTEREYASLFERSGWLANGIRSRAGSAISVLAATAVDVRVASTTASSAT